MRLTLRTLLAWMDDTLPAGEVKDIGQQVDTSPFAQQLIERIRKVTRRRRLTVPSTSGPEAIDPNLVAAYLDNELDSDRVSEFEKLCLTSDVHLAEVASAHQILSMIKHKAKVPAEARYRMYRLVRGREATRGSERGAGAHTAAASRGFGPAVPPWTPEPAPKAPAWERFGPPLIAAGLMAVLAWVGFTSLQAPEVVRPRPTAEPVAEAEAEPTEPFVDAELPAPDPAPALPPAAKAEHPAEATEPPPVAAATPGSPVDRQPPPPAATPAGAAGVVAASDGLLLRHRPADAPNGETDPWERLRDGDALRAGDRIVHLNPLVATIRLGQLPVTLVGESELIVGTPADGQAARFEMVRGRVVLPPVGADSAETALPVAIDFAGKSLTVTRPDGEAIGLVGLGLRAPGQPEGHKALDLHVAGGRVEVSTDPAAASTAIQGPAFQRFDPQAGWGPVVAGAVPPWVKETTPSPVARQLGAEFLGLFGDGTVLLSLLEGVEDARIAVRQLSVAALGALGEDELVAALLGREKAPDLRLSAISVFQARLAEHPDGLTRLQPLLEDYTETPDDATELIRLLVGFSAEEAAQESTYERLVKDLESSNLSVRELAIVHLMGLTHRDRLGYDPDDPTAGARAWRALLEEGGLRPVAPPPPAEGPAPAPAPASGSAR